MNKITAFLVDLGSQFQQAIIDSKHTEPAKNQKLYLNLCLASMTLLVIAACGYLIGDYQWGFAAINSMSSQIPVSLLHHLTSFGDGLFIFSLVLFLANRNAPLLYSGFIAAVIGGLITHFIKYYFNAPRPPAVLEQEAFNLIGQAYYSRSFPSGHTLTAFLTSTIVICFCSKRLTQIMLFSLALAVGLSRVWLGVHWVIDILVGAALGILCGLFSVYLGKRLSPDLSKTVFIVIISLYSLAAIAALSTPNDYHHAQLMIYATAILALWRTFQSYLRPIILKRITVFQDSYFSAFLITLIIITVYRVLVILQPHMTLFYDEAYYYHWSLTPDLGYYSKPPFVAWLISLSTMIFGHTVLGVKLAAPLIYSLSGYIVFLTAKKVASTNAGIVAGLIFITAPVIGFNSEFITTDAPLILFWSLSIYLFIHCLEKDRLSHWICLGCAIGFGMLSKYTMILLPVSFLAFVLIDTQRRTLLVSYKPWLAGLIAMTLFSLNLWWNSENGWISFLHTSEISQQKTDYINLNEFFEFLAGQIFVIGPIWCFLSITLVLKRKRLINLCKDELSFAPMLFIFCTLGILLIISLQALASGAFVNWAAPWVVGCSLLLGIYICSYNVKRYLKIGMITHLVILSAFYHWPKVLDHLQIEQTRKNNPYQRLAGWDIVAAELKPVLEASPQAFLASDSRDLLAYLGFHAKPGSLALARWNPNKNDVRDHYDLKYNLRQLSDTDTSYIFVSKQALSPSQLASFDTAFSLGEIQHQVFRDKINKIYVYKLIGFNGYK